jgi:hypothetical protein
MMFASSSYQKNVLNSNLVINVLLLSLYHLKFAKFIRKIIIINIVVFHITYLRNFIIVQGHALA